MMKESILFKKVRTEDIRNSIEIIQNSFKERYLRTSIYSCHGINNYLNYEFSNKCSPYIYFGLYYNNTIIAFSEFKLFFEESTAFLNIIAVDSEFTNCKYGTSLLSKSIEELKIMGFKNIELDVFTSNITALKWYKKFGFIEEYENMYSEVNIQKYHVVTKDNIQILNYPQSKIIIEKFGFGIISILYKNKIIELGIINNSLVIRNSFHLDILNQINHIVELYKISNIFYTGKKTNCSNIFDIDKIKRLKLSI